jgi:hypothetical protein
MTNEELEEIKEQFCDEYCRWPREYDEVEEGIPLSSTAICAQCPIESLRV